MTPTKALERDTMDELIERLENAKGPDRDLDAFIAREVGAYPSDWQTTLPGYSLEYFLAWSSCAPAYTSSIDAALTLVPEGHGYIINAEHGEKPQASIPYDAGSGYMHALWYFAATPALALCIASLKARKQP